MQLWSKNFSNKFKNGLSSICNTYRYCSLIFTLLGENSHMKYAVITGVSSGIGEAVANKLIKRGVYVFGIDIVQPLNNNIEFYNCNVCDAKALEMVIKSIKRVTNRLDYVLLSAGILCCGNRLPLDKMTFVEWNGVIETNLTGVMNTIKIIAPLLGANSSVITISSEQTQHIIPKSAPYLVSKAGVEALTRLAALEFIKRKIRVNCIRIATVKTNFLSTLIPKEKIIKEMNKEMNQKMPLGIIKTSDVVNLVMFIFSKKSEKITGQIITLDSGILLYTW